MKFSCVLFPLLILCSGCLLQEKSEPVTLDSIMQTVAERHLTGETAAELRRLAKSSRQATEWSKLPDLAEFIRNDNGERKYILSRKILWESILFARVQFHSDPEKFVRNWNAGELRCRLLTLLAESEFLRGVIWKTPAQQSRENELFSELQQLTGTIPEEVLASIPLAMPEDWKKIKLPMNLPVGEDPAEPLQAAGVFYLLPEEIRRQQLADPELKTEGILQYAQMAAACYTLDIIQRRLEAAQSAYMQESSAENLWNFRKWFYMYQLDISRLPENPGVKKDLQFIESMLLLQAGF